MLPSVGFALVWAVAAMARAEVTYHLAPIIVAAAGPMTGRSVSAVDRRALVASALGVALAVTLALSSVGALRGPSLLPVGGAALEAVVGAILGAVATLALTASRDQSRSPAVTGTSSRFSGGASGHDQRGEYTHDG